MFSRHEVREFFNFLETASDQQLAERRTHLQALVGIYPADSDARRDARFLLRHLAEEQAVRLNVRQVRVAYAKRAAARR